MLVNELRERFSSLNMREKMRLSDFLLLVAYLQNCLEESFNKKECTIKMEVNPFRYRNVKPGKYVEITIRGSYFKSREGFSFYADGSIGFCGWASGVNETPILRAFDRWLKNYE